MIQIRALGTCEIQIGRKRVTLSTEMVFALGFYLCVRAGERVGREELTETFWSGRDVAKDRHSLRQMLYRLRQKGLELDEDGEELSLDPTTIESDVARVLDPSWAEKASAEDVELAGDLLPGFTRTITPRFQEWLDGVRAEVAAQHRRGALAQIIRARREARWADLERWAQHVLRSDPLNEEATLARAESAAMAGSKAAALEILDQYMEELGEYAPQIGLPATVLRRRIAERQPDWTARGPREVPLVGRAELMSRLTGFVEAASRGEGTGVVLWGAPGVGKTRLAQETRIFAELRGFKTVVVRSDKSHSARPLSTLLTLLPLVRDLPGAAGCSPASLAVVQRVLREGVVASSLTPTAPGSSDQAVFVAAVQDLFRAVAEETRTLVILDDLHNADASSGSILRALAVTTARARMLWIATSRGRPSADSQGTGLASVAFMAIVVPPLPTRDAERLAESVSASQPRPRAEAEIEAIARTAAGNPFFVCELTAQRNAGAQSLPGSLRELMQERIAHLTQPEVRALRIIATLGHSATAARLRNCLGLPTSATASVVEHLEDEGLLHLGPSQSLELHECWLSETTEQMTDATRALLSLECAELLQGESAENASLDSDWRAAELYAVAGERDRALALFLTCAQRMHHMGLATDSVQVLDRALTLAKTDSELLRILSLKGRALYDAGAVEDVVSVCSAALAMRVPEIPDNAFARTIMQALLVDSLTKLHRDHREALATLARLARDKRTPAQARQFACLFGIRVVFNDATSPLEREFADASVAATEASGLSTLGLLTRVIFSTERGTVGDVESAVDALDSFAEPDEPLKLRSLRLRYSAIALRWIGQSDEAVRRATDAFQFSHAAGLTDEASSAAEFIAYTRMDDELLDEAERWMTVWSEALRSGSYASRHKSFAHATSRMFLQRGLIDEALGMYIERLGDVERDLLAKRRVSDLATIAYCAVASGRRELGRDALDRATRILADEQPSGFVDYSAELCVRTLRELGENEQATCYRRTYLGERNLRFQRPLARFCRELGDPSPTFS